MKHVLCIIILAALVFPATAPAKPRPPVRVRHSVVVPGGPVTGPLTHGAL